MSYNSSYVANAICEPYLNGKGALEKSLQKAVDKIDCENMFPSVSYDSGYDKLLADYKTNIEKITKEEAENKAKLAKEAAQSQDMVSISNSETSFSGMNSV